MIRPWKQATGGKGSFSLLWPRNVETPHEQPEEIALSPETRADLRLHALVEALGGSRYASRDMEQILGSLPADAGTIVYRQDIFQDIVDNPSLLSCLQELYPSLDAQGSRPRSGAGETTVFHEMVFRLDELSSFVTCVQKLQQELVRLGDGLVSRGFRELRERITAIAEDRTFRRLVEELPEIRRRARTVRSVTVGINLDQKLAPCEAVLVSVDEEKYSSKPGGILDRLTGKSGSGLQGIGPLHSGPVDSSDYAAMKDLPYEYKPMLIPLFRDLSDIMNKTAIPILREIKRYSSLGTDLFTGLRPEILFYLRAADFVGRLEKEGFSFCKPRIMPASEGVIRIRDSFNVLLALSYISDDTRSRHAFEDVVCNDVRFDQHRGIQILTGPNQGGKTVYVQAVGIAVLLAQVGLFVPGKSAEISPVDSILTHFQVEEPAEGRSGRFGDEAQRLAHIFRKATPRSLILMNESLSSTSGDESVYIAEDLIRAFRLLGCRVLFATHLHELAGRAEKLSEEPRGSTGVISIVAGIDSEHHTGEGMTRRTYRITPGPPMGHSYAMEIAARYGVGFEQLSELITSRGYGDGSSGPKKQPGGEE